jgi:hypothetical protein
MGCELVLVLRDMIGHNQRDNAVRLARATGIQFHEVPRKFAKASMILQKYGFNMLKRAPTPPEDEMNATPAALKPPTTKQKYDAAVAYLIAEGSEDRAPNRDQVRGHIKHLFGPKVSIADTQVNRAREEAADSLELARAEGNRDFREYAASEITHYPEHSDFDVLVTLRDLYDGKLPVKDSNALAIIADARSQLTEEWRSLARSGPMEKRQALTLIKREWLSRLISKAMREGGEDAIPSYNVVHTQAKNLFGSSVQASDIAHFRRTAVEHRGEDPVPPAADDAKPPVVEDTPPEGVASGKDLYAALTLADEDELLNWIRRNMEAEAPKAPNRKVRKMLPVPSVGSVVHATILRLAEPALTLDAMTRCYEGLGSKEFDPTAWPVVGEALGFLDLESPPNIPEAEVAPEAEVEASVRQAAVPAQAESLVTRLHPDDRAVLVAELRAAVNEDAATREDRIIRAIEAARTEAREMASATQHSQATIIDKQTTAIDALTSGLQSLSDALVRIESQTSGRALVRLDDPSRALIEGLQRKVEESMNASVLEVPPAPNEDAIVARVLDGLRSEMPTAQAAPTATHELTVREVFESGRAIHIEAAKGEV